MLWEVKILTKHTITKEIIKEGPLSVGSSVLAFVAKKGQSKGQRSVHEQGEAELRIFYLSSDTRNILNILAPARLVPSNCASAPRNTREAGISSFI